MQVRWVGQISDWVTGWDRYRDMANCSAVNEQIWVLQVAATGLCMQEITGNLLRHMQACCSLKVLLQKAALGAAQV